MIELFACLSPNVLKVVIALEELGLPYKTTLPDIINGEARRMPFIAINPNGRVPAITDSEGPDGQPINVAESGAILYYLAQKHGKFFSADPRKATTIMQWLMFQMSGTGPMLGQYVYFTRRVENQPHAVDRYGSEVIRLHEVVERRLGESRFIAGDEYTIADIALYPGLKMVNIEGEDRSVYTNMNRWLDEISARPAVERAREALKGMTLTGGDGKNDFTEDQNDALFGRGKYSRLKTAQGA